jgi:hypothetical protein
VKRRLTLDVAARVNPDANKLRSVSCSIARNLSDDAILLQINLQTLNFITLMRTAGVSGHYVAPRLDAHAELATFGPGREAEQG